MNMVFTDLKTPSSQTKTWDIWVYTPRAKLCSKQREEQKQGLGRSDLW